MPNQQTRTDPLTVRETAIKDLTVRELPVETTTLDEKTRSIDAVLTTESIVPVYDFASGRVIDEILLARGMVAESQVPLLEAHMRFSLDNVFGSVRDIRTESDKAIGRLFFAEGQEDVERAWNKTKQGHLKDVSAGYRVLQYTDISPGTSRVVDGVNYTASGERTLRISTRWQLREVSLVPIGADQKSKVREEIQDGPIKPSMEAIAMNEMQRKYLESLGLRSDATLEVARAFANELGGEQKARAEALETKPKAAATPPAEPTPEGKRTEPPTEEATSSSADDVAAERNRCADVEELLAGHSDVPPELKGQAIREGWSVDRTGREALAKIGDNVAKPVTPDTGTVAIGTDGGERMRAALTDAVCLSVGIVPDKEVARNAAMVFEGIGMQDLARALIRQENGDMTIGTDALFRRAITSQSFSEILGVSAHKTLAREYEEYPSTAMLWAGKRSPSNFQEYKDIRLGAFATIDEVGRSGEIKHEGLPEAMEPYQVTTYGRQWSISRQEFINDNLGAFLRVPGQLGMLAKRNIDDVAYTLLISAAGLGPTMNEDSIALFNASHVTGSTTSSNYSTGATASAMTKTGLKAAKLLMRTMKGMAAETMNLTPDILLVPAALEEAALELTTSPNLLFAATNDGSTAVTYDKAASNIYAGTMRAVVEPRLDAATNGATAWYLISKAMDSLVIAFLNGKEAPVVERADPPNVLGIGWRMYHDMGAAFVDFRGINRSKGA